MMSLLDNLILQVSQTRNSFIQTTKGLTIEQVNFKSDEQSWSILENVEHITRAERAGVYKMWMAVEAYKKQPNNWTNPPIHHGLSVEEIIAKTWQPKEQVPDIAKPCWGGTLDFWITSLKACHPVLVELGNALKGLDLEQIIYSHPISGPMNMIQRVAFLGFHLGRHEVQIESIKMHPNFPIF